MQGGRTMSGAPCGQIHFPGTDVADRIGPMFGGECIIQLKQVIMKGYHTYKACIEACLNCAAICNHCASSCTQEDQVNMMAKCIQLDMECATLCYAAAQLMSLGSETAKEICRLCMSACEACAAECGKHQTEHCQECAKACTACADQCRKMAA